MPLLTTFGGAAIKRFGLGAGSGAFFAEVLIVAGGGAGHAARTYSNCPGGLYGSGGGGAGGYREFSGATAIRMAKGDIFGIIVGAGGAVSSSGSCSKFGTYCSTGGGYGDAGPGGSGGGKGQYCGHGGGGNAGGYTPSEGNNGGSVAPAWSPENFNAGAGGGGACTSGESVPHQRMECGIWTVGGAGGCGKASSITGSSCHRAGGGGGGNNGDWTGHHGGYHGPGAGAGGEGGGGEGGYAPGAGASGGTNRGGGGGGGGSAVWTNDGQTQLAAATNGGTGGSGIVIVAYPISGPAITTIDAGLTYSVSTVSRSGYRVYSFTAGSGNITI